MLPPEKPFTIYRSSAGSGKTYTLTREYLKLALRNPQYFRTILAVTFTNKATQEMKSRIIETLHALSEGHPHGMRSELMEATGLTANQLQERALVVRSAILHNYSHFAVSTIDSFFQKIVRSFAKEIGLRAGFRVELDQPKVLDALIDGLMEQVGQDKQLTTWLTQFSEEQLDEGKSWDIRRSIRSLAGEIFSEGFKQHEPELQKLATEKNALSKLLGQLKKVRQDYETKMDRIGREANEAMLNGGFDTKDFAYGASGVAGHFTKILKDKKDYVPGKRALEALEDPEKWASKSNKQRDAVITFASTNMQGLLQEAVDLYRAEHRIYESAKVVQQNIYTLGILTNLTKLLEDYRETEDVLLISDTAVFLREIIGETETPFIYEKTGSYFQHFLIDEFQDTSGFQWENFRPLVSNSLAAGNQNLIVGDVKQSIYRWRGGNWKLLLEKIEQDIGSPSTQIKQLVQNWRSCPLIIDFNNSLFQRAAEELQTVCLEKVSENTEELEMSVLEFEAHQLSRAYQDVAQDFPKQKSAQPCGYIESNFLDDKEEEQHWKELAQQAMLEKVKVLQDNGYQPRDITILVRSNGDGKELADILMQAEQQRTDERYCYRVISSDALYVDSATSVKLMLGALRLLNNPEDAITRVTLAYDYQRYILERADLHHHDLFAKLGAEDGLAEWGKQYLPAGFIDRLSHLSKLPLYELTETFIRIFGLEKLEGEWAYIQAFQDAVLRYGLDERGDVDSFLEWWLETGSRRTVQISDEVNAIRILTVHTSKCLQFKAVLMPYCQWELNHKPSATNYLWTKTDTYPLKEAGVLPIKYGAGLKDTLFAQTYFSEMLQAFLDNLNLLYVAFTRAENCLITWSPLPSLRGNPVPKAEHVNGLLYRILSGNQQTRDTVIKGESIDFSKHWNGDILQFQLGELERLNAKSSAEEDNQFSLKKYASSRWRNRLTVKRRNASLALATDEIAAAQINWSRTLHTLLQHIKLPEDLDSALETIYYEGLVTETELPAVRRQMQKVFSHPVAGQWFQPDWKVRTELPLLTTTGTLLQPDRVVSRDNSAIVIDFLVEDIRPGHTRRVQRYIDLLQKMGFRQVTGYTFYMNESKAVEVTSGTSSSQTTLF
jgi:ATP-dependent exoDNAse (exonuclease V) beta subunit